MDLSTVKIHTLSSSLMRGAMLITILIAMLLSSFYSHAEEEILTIEGARIRGNQELPTILYLIPWQPPELQSLDVPQQSFAVQRPLEPLERAQFQRMMSYHQHFKAGQKTQQDIESKPAPK